MMEKLTHWKKLMNPEYLGGYALQPGQELIATIKTVGNEEVTGTDGKKEICSVIHFVEDIKPMILNATNNKTIANLFKTPYIEQWAGRKIQIYIRGRSGSLVFPSLEEFSTIFCDPHSQRLWHSQ